MSGGVDVGKTHLAIAVARRWLARSRPAKFSLVPKLLDELREGYRPDAQIDYTARFDVFCNADLLILDDLGMESPTRWAQEKLDMIIDHRYINGLPLMITTNLGVRGLPERMASRLMRARGAHWVNLDAPEYRLKRKPRG